VFFHELFWGDIAYVAPAHAEVLGVCLIG